MRKKKETAKKDTVNIEDNGNLGGDNDKRDVERNKEKEDIIREHLTEEIEVEVDDVKEEEEGKKEQEENKGNQEKTPEEELELKLGDILNNIVVLEEKIQDLEAEKEDNTKRMQRLQADFTNYRKRSEKEMARIHTTTLVELIGQLLPIIDNFERALEQEETENDFRKGIEMIYRQVLLFLEKNGVETIEAVGKEFDPNYHNAVIQVETDEYEAGVITEELQKGYILDEYVIRPSMVKVAQ